MSTMIKGYEVHESLGEGAFGEVYRATSPPPLNAEVAIKFIKPKYASQPDFIRRFESEATMVANLQCPYITPITNYWRDPDGAYIVMWYIRGGNLKESLKNGPYDVRRASRVLTQICAALSYAHRNGVIHRDVKPANILLDEEGNAFLSDFGIAKNLQQPGGPTNTGEFVGTVGYTAPEQIRGTAVSPATDIYSLGVILYEMLAGEHPFPKLNQVEQIYKSLDVPLPLLDGLDESIQDSINIIIQKATEKDPAKRYQDAIEMASAFRDAIASVIETSPQTIVESLTMREQDILKLIVERKSNREIATALFITKGTVKWYVNQIYKKLKVRNRVEAIIKARELNLIFDDADSDSENGHTQHTYVFLEEPDNPYKGLSAFTLADERDFYGRRAITEKLLNRLRQETAYHRFLTIIGPSGSGKSSLVKAGLVPAVLRGELEGSEHWFVTDMIPGAHPIDELEVALMRVAADQANSIGEQIRRDERGLVRVSQLLLPDDGSELLIVIDQFEEVFTLVEDENDRQHFLDLIYTAITDPRSRVRVVATLRADFFDRPLQYPGFGDVLRERMETILPLSAEELEQAIIKPAANVGVRYEEGVVARIISDINYQPGALPLLQFALTELFENRHNRTITAQAYQEIGGTIGALAKRADELFLALDEDGQAAARQMLLRLVTLGEGTEDTRRRVTREELLSVAGDGDLMDEIIDLFASYRLLALDHDPVTRLPTVEVAHEAILREWKMLRGWLNDSRDDIKMQRQLADAAGRWDEGNRDTGHLLHGGPLQEFERWQEMTQLARTPLEMEFLEASVSERKRREANERARVEREASLQLRARRVLQGLVAMFLVATIVSGGFGVEANRQRGLAEDERDKAEREAVRAERAEDEAREESSRAKASVALEQLEDGFQDLAVETALSAMADADTPEAFGSLAEVVDNYQSFATFVRTDQFADAYSISQAPDGSKIIYDAGGFGDVYLVDTDSGRHQKILTFSSDLCREHQVNSKWHPEREIVLLWTFPLGATDRSCSDEVLIADLSTDVPQISREANPENVVWADWSPDGDTILTATVNGELYFWDFADGIMTDPISTGIEIQQVAWSPGNDHIAIASTGNLIRIMEIDSNEVVSEFRSGIGTISAIDWSPNGQNIIVGGTDGVVRNWNAQSGLLERIYSGNSSSIDDVAWSPVDNKIGATTDSSILFIWDAESSDVIATLRTLNGFGMIWSSDGKELVVPSYEARGVSVFDISANCILNIPDNFVLNKTSQWSPSGELILTSAFDGVTRIWRAATCEQINEFESSQSSGWSAWSPDGSKIVQVNIDNNVFVRDIESGEIVFQPAVDIDFDVITASWSPDSTKIALQTFYCANNCEDTSGEHPLLIWDVTTEVLVNTLLYDETPEGNCYFPFPTWSPDSSKVAAACTDTDSMAPQPVVIWDVESGEVIGELSAEAVPWRAQWSANESLLLAGYFDGSVRIWDTQSGELLKEFQAGIDAIYPDWSPNEDYFVTGSFAGDVAIWNAQSGEMIYSINAPGLVQEIDWSPDGEHIVMGGAFEPIIIRVWTDAEELIKYAYDCCVPDREFDDEERAKYEFLSDD